MIIDHIDNAAIYSRLNPYLPRIFDFIIKIKIETLKKGRNEIDGDNLFVIYEKNTNNRPIAEAQLEAHRSYGDLHYVINGSERIGCRKTDTCTQPFKGMKFDEEKDYILYEDEPTEFHAIEACHFWIAFPQDAHIPKLKDINSTENPYDKLVFKFRCTVL